MACTDGDGFAPLPAAASSMSDEDVLVEELGVTEYRDLTKAWNTLASVWPKQRHDEFGFARYTAASHLVDATVAYIGMYKALEPPVIAFTSTARIGFTGVTQSLYSCLDALAHATAIGVFDKRLSDRTQFNLLFRRCQMTDQSRSLPDAQRAVLLEMLGETEHANGWFSDFERVRHRVVHECVPFILRNEADGGWYLMRPSILYPDAIALMRGEREAIAEDIFLDAIPYQCAHWLKSTKELLKVCLTKLTGILELQVPQNDQSRLGG